MLGLTPPTFPVTTPRLRLRLFAADDRDSLHAYRSLSEVVRYMYRPPSRARAYLGRRAVQVPHRDGDWLTLGVELPVG